MEKNLRRLPDIAVLVGLALLMLIALNEELGSYFYTDDLLWFVPTIMEGMRGKGMFDALLFILDPRHSEFAVPLLSLHTYGVTALFGARFEALLASSFALHLCGSVLMLMLVARTADGEDPKAASPLAAAAFYLAAYIHSDAWIWPMAIQHQQVVVLSLLTMILYLRAEQREGEGRVSHARLLALAAAFATSFTRLSSCALAFAIYVHIAFCSADVDMRRKAFKRWVPLFLIFLGYPLMDLAVAGSDSLCFLTPGKWTRPDLALARYLFFGAIGAVGIGSAGFLISRPWKSPSRRTVLAASCVLLILPAGRKLLMSLLTFSGAEMSALLFPGAHASSGFNRFRWNMIPTHLSEDLWIPAGILFLALLAKMVRARRALILPAAFSLAGFVFLGFSHSVADGAAAPSRYFLYIAPCAAVVFSALPELFSRALGRLGRPRTTRVAVLAAAVVVLAINVHAIGLHLFRYRLVSHYSVYDSLRAGALMAEANTSSPNLRLRGVGLLPYAESWDSFIRLPIDHYFPVRAAATPSRKGVRINDEPANGSEATYRMAGHHLVDEAERPVEFFTRQLNEGLELLRGGRAAQARPLIEAAIARRPFLLRFLLGTKPIGELAKITNGSSLESWLSQIRLTWASVPGRELKPDDAADRIHGIMKAEVRDYVLALLARAWIEDQSGTDPMPTLAACRYFVSGGDELLAEFEKDPRVDAVGFREFLRKIATRL